MKYVFSILVLFGVYSSLMAQDTLNGKHDTLMISSGLHIIKSVVTADKELLIREGAIIEFTDGGLIVANGAVNIKGSPTNRVVFKGAKLNPGKGLIIKEVKDLEVSIVYTDFTGLLSPLTFDYGWRRTRINIAHNEFYQNVGKVSLVQVSNPFVNAHFDSTYAVFMMTQNLFANNSASIYFEDFANDHTDYHILSNAFVGNHLYGFSNYNIATNMLYGRLDDLSARFTAEVKGNSFVDNFQYESRTDTLVHKANFGVYGTEKQLNLFGNYWGIDNVKLLREGVYDQLVNYSSPATSLNPFLTIPGDTIPTHIFKITDDKDSLLSPQLDIRKAGGKFKLQSNKKVDIENAELHYIHFKDSVGLKIVDTIIRSNFNEVNAKNTEMSYNQKNINTSIAYFSVQHITDDAKSFVPLINIGYNVFALEMSHRQSIEDERVRAEESKSDSLSKMSKDSLKQKIKALEQQTPIPKDPTEVNVKGRIEVGIYSGTSIFYGTIANKSLFKNDQNLLIGAQLKYRYRRKVSLSFGISSFKLSNSDYNSDNNSQISRGMSFITSMMQINLGVNYHFFDLTKYSKKTKWRPSVGAGIDLFSFNPTGVYKGVTYNLHSLGTGGQMVDSSAKPYSLMAMALYFTVEMKYYFNTKTSIGFHASYHFSKSDYLDDVGSNVYPDPTKLLAKNPGLIGQAAVYFSNPTARKTYTGELRNDPGRHDQYMLYGISISRRLFTK